MKALFISNDPTVFIQGHATRIRMKGYADAIGELYIISRSPQAVQEDDGNLHIRGVKTSKLFAPSALARVARAIVRKESIDVVSAQDPFEHGWAGLKAVRGTSAKLHIQVHTDFLSPWFVKSGSLRSQKVRMPFLNRIRRRLAEKVLPKADGIRTVSERVKASLVLRYGTRIPEPSVIPIRVDVTIPPAIPLPPHDFTFTLITAGRLEPEKRIEDIIDALARVLPKYPSVGLVVIGDGRERARLEGQVRSLGLSHNVQFLGEKTSEETLGLMQSAHAYIQASAYEGYGRTLVEAALARVPIITTDVGIVGEVLRGYRDVLAAPVADPAALAVHIAGLVEDQQSRHMLPMEAERAVRTHLEGVGDQASRIAEDLLRATKTPSNRLQ